MTSFYSLTLENLRAYCNQRDLPAATAAHLFNWHYKKRQTTECKAHNFTNKARDTVYTELSFDLPKIRLVSEATDKTVKLLFTLSDGREIETVLIPFQKKYTICLSSQVGCAMKCSFCYTGEQGFQRHLRSEEIVGQFLQAQRWLSTNRPGDDRISNIVYMGQGEPLHNLEAVRDSARIFIAQHGLSLADHKITVSTSGYLPGLQRWKVEMPDVNIALSLHSPFAEKRNSLIPINRRYPLEELLPVIDAIPTGKKRFVTYEYLLIKNFNDSADDAHATGKLLQNKKAYINLIPFNAYPGSKYKRPEDERVAAFKDVLDSYRIPTLIRTTKGDPILAACGQLHTAGTRV